MELFTLYKKIFTTKPKEFQKLNNLIIKKHSFMINRFMSIKFPLIANDVNSMNMDGAYIIKWWNIKCYQNYDGNIPKWIYTKTNKLDKKIKAKTLKKTNIKKGDFINYVPTQEVLSYYTCMFGDDLKDLEHYLKHYENDTKRILYHLEQSLINNEQ